MEKPWLKCLVSMQSELFFPLECEAGHILHAVLDNKPLQNLPKTTRNGHYKSCASFLVTLLQYKPVPILFALQWFTRPWTWVLHIVKWKQNLVVLAWNGTALFKGKSLLSKERLNFWILISFKMFQAFQKYKNYIRKELIN